MYGDSIREISPPLAGETPAATTYGARRRTVALAGRTSGRIASSIIAAALIAAGALPVAGLEPSLICFGNEPSWSVALREPDGARLTLPDEPAVEFRGTASRIEALRERVWRGQPVAGPGGDLVLFLREGACSDNMSDLKHPITARLSLPNGRFLAGCCRIPAPAAGQGAPDGGIEGRTWRLTHLTGLADEELAAIRDGVTVRLEDGRLQAFGGCNRMAGSYTLAADHLTVGALAGTMMACPQPAMRVESAFGKALTGRFTITAGEDRMQLAQGSTELTFVAEPPPRLENVQWTVTGYNNGRHAVVSPLVGTTLTLSFEDGSVAGHAGCNSFRAQAVIEENRLSVGPIAATRKMCPGEGVMEQEREFLAALETATAWAIDRGMLDVHRADGERVLTASAKSAEER